MIFARENYLFLAEQHLRAAEAFGSLGPLDKSDRFLRPLVEGDRFLAPLELLPPVKGLLYFNLDSFKTQDFGMRLAVERARLTRSRIDLERAKQIVADAYAPILLQAAQNAYAAGDDFCDVREDEGLTELRAACLDDPDLQARVTNYWINRATLDLVEAVGEAAPRQSKGYELAIRLLDAEGTLRGSSRSGNRSSQEDLLKLHLVEADHLIRQLDATGSHPDLEEVWQNALSALAKGKKLAQPYTASTQFRRIAQAWLNTWARAAEFGIGADGPKGIVRPSSLRYAAYLKRLLDDLPSIAMGNETGLDGAGGNAVRP